MQGEEKRMPASLPRGPRSPRPIQTLGWWTRQTAFLEQCRARYGKRFTIRMLGAPPWVNISTPEEIAEIFKAPPEVLHPGEGARIMRPVVGSHSLILLDEDEHLEQRKLLLPAFHGKKMQGLTGLITEVAEQEVASWPRNETLVVHARVKDLTLEIILRAVFGLDEGERLDALRAALTGILAFGVRPENLLPAMQRDLGSFTRWSQFTRIRERADGLIYDLLGERRRDGGEDRDDIMAMLLSARHEDGSPMSPKEVRDELMTLLIAGHETTAAELAWAFERLGREPRVLKRLQQEIDADGGDDYLTATIQETLRRRPVLPNAEPRLTKREVEIGGWLYPEGVCLIANAYLLHHDPDVYPDPYAFRPERFLDEPPGTYTWIPFGGGRRRCIGARFAMLEMKIVLRAVLERAQIVGGGERVERPILRGGVISPRAGTPTVLCDRVREPSGPVGT
jgi:cytochrome P450